MFEPAEAKQLLTVNGHIYVSTAKHAVLAMGRAMHRPEGNGFHVTCRQWAKRLVEIAHVSTSIRGMDHIDWSLPSVVMSNHASLYDIPVLFHTLPTDLNFLSKKELQSIPFLGWAMDAGGFVFIDRKNPTAARLSIDAAAEQVTSGKTVAIFPEGTRTKDGLLRPFKKGGFVLAIKSKAQIIPVYVDGTYDILPRDTLLVQPGHVEVRVGPAVNASNFDIEQKEALMGEVRGSLQELADVEPLQPTGPF